MLLHLLSILVSPHPSDDGACVEDPGPLTLSRAAHIGHSFRDHLVDGLDVTPEDFGQLLAIATHDVLPLGLPASDPDLAALVLWLVELFEDAIQLVVDQLVDNLRIGLLGNDMRQPLRLSLESGDDNRVPSLYSVSDFPLSDDDTQPLNVLQKLEPRLGLKQLTAILLGLFSSLVPHEPAHDCTGVEYPGAAALARSAHVGHPVGDHLVDGLDVMA